MWSCVSIRSRRFTQSSGCARPAQLRQRLRRRSNHHQSRSEWSQHPRVPSSPQCTPRTSCASSPGSGVSSSQSGNHRGSKKRGGYFYESTRESCRRRHRLSNGRCRWCSGRLAARRCPHVAETVRTARAPGIRWNQHAVSGGWPRWRSSPGIQPAGSFGNASGRWLPEGFPPESQTSGSIEAPRRSTSWCHVRSQSPHQPSQCDSHHPVLSESQTRSKACIEAAEFWRDASAFFRRP